MKILIVGTGVIGTLYAQALSNKNEVIHFVRKNKFNDVNNKTIPFDIIDERESKKNMYTKGEYTYRCVTKIDCNYDLIIVPVNTYQLYETLKTLTKEAPNANYLIFTLNWEGTRQIDNILNKDNYIMGYSGGGGTFKGELLFGNIGNDVMLGSVYENQKPLFNNTARMFKECSIIPKIPENVLHWLWIHNVDSAPLGVGLSQYNSLNECIKDKKLTKICFKAMGEGYKICKKRGVNLTDFPETKMTKIPFFILYRMFKHNFEKNPIMQRYTAHAVLAIDEMKSNFKQIFDTGKELGMNMPNMEKLYKLL